jgi:hypothetical protein
MQGVQVEQMLLLFSVMVVFDQLHAPAALSPRKGPNKAH